MINRLGQIIATAIFFVCFLFPQVGAAEIMALPQSTLLNVPYAGQVPLGEWTDLRQREGCEEASIRMAMMWIWGGQSAPLEEIRRDIINLSEYEKVIYGSFVDSSAADTASLMQSYYNHPGITVTYNIALIDIKMQLAAGNLVLVPVDASKLYPGGPLRHTLVVTGYDNQTQEMIVHDSLLARGSNMHLKESALAQALGDYKTGTHVPLGLRSTAMIVVSK